jgi:hypothetical protein
VTALNRMRRFSIVTLSHSDESLPIGTAPSDEIVMISACRSRGTWASLWLMFSMEAVDPADLTSAAFTMALISTEEVAMKKRRRVDV